jgi:hypothetical protein
LKDVKNMPLIAAALFAVILIAVFFVFRSVAPAPEVPLDEPPIAQNDTPAGPGEAQPGTGSESPGMHSAPVTSGPPFQTR